MSKSNTTENDILKMILQGTDPSWRAGATQYVALHTADPADAGTAVCKRYSGSRAYNKFRCPDCSIIKTLCQ